MTTQSGPLSGLTVVEMAGLGPAPLAGQLLADLGATVTVVDRAAAAADATDINRRNKRSIALDLKQPEAVAIVIEMAVRADVLIEGFRPGVMERLGLGPDTLLERHPALVYARMTGWGQSGPLASTAGHDLNYLALSGALGAMGDPTLPPPPPLNLVGDYGGGTMFLLFGVFAALWERDRSGAGQVVDAAMVDGVPAMMGLMHQWVARGEWADSRGANLLDGGAPFYRCYETADRQYLSVGPLEPAFFKTFVAGLEIDPSDMPPQYDRDGWPAWQDRIAARIASQSRAHWEAVFAGSDACVTPVLSFSEAMTHPHNAARDTWIDVDGVAQAAPAPRFSRTPAPEPRAPGAPGAEAELILRELGYSAEAVRAARTNGAVLGSDAETDAT